MVPIQGGTVLDATMGEIAQVGGQPPRCHGPRKQGAPSKSRVITGENVLLPSQRCDRISNLGSAKQDGEL
jgi:hypothetical protein